MFAAILCEDEEYFSFKLSFEMFRERFLGRQTNVPQLEMAMKDERCLRKQLIDT